MTGLAEAHGMQVTQGLLSHWVPWLLGSPPRGRRGGRKTGWGGAVGLGYSPKKAAVTPAGSSELDGPSVLEERGTVLHVLV